MPATIVRTTPLPWVAIISGTMMNRLDAGVMQDRTSRTAPRGPRTRESRPPLEVSEASWVLTSVALVIGEIPFRS
jgi:hypothetical protein